MPGRILIVGAPRSGTTLVQSLLAAHPQVAGFTESHFLNRHFAALPGGVAVLKRDPAARVAAFLAENGLPPALAPDWPLARRLRPTATARALFGVLDRAAAARGRTRWVEKTPRHLHYLPLIGRALPDARFVHVLRRRADVVRSLERASRAWGRPLSAAACERRWEHDLRISLAHAHRPGHCLVAYEALVADPAGVTSRLLAALGLPRDETVVERHAQAAEPLIAAGEHWKAAALGPIAARHPAGETAEADPLYLRGLEAAL